MWYWIFRPFVITLMKVCFRLTAEGTENVPQKTNFIVVSNHTSYLDPFVVGAAIPKRIYWVAIRDLYRPSLIRWFMQKTETLPVGRSSAKVLQMLTENKNVGLFPEGTRTRDGSLREFRRGAALLAVKTGRPILPCAIIGAFEAYPPKARFPKFSKIKIKIGKPKYLLKEFDDVVDDLLLQNGIFEVRNRIKEMLNAG